MKSSAPRATTTAPRSSAKKNAAGNAESLKNLCTERLTLIDDYTNQPENREAIGAALEANRLAQKLLRLSPAAAARSARAAVVKAAH